MRRLLCFCCFMMWMAAAWGQNLDVSLRKIEYHNGGCSDENAIQVRVNFVTDYKNPQDLSMVIKYDASTTYTVQVKEYDRDGNISYSFCSKEGEANIFRIYFRTQGGIQSNVFDICAIPRKSKIMD